MDVTALKKKYAKSIADEIIDMNCNYTRKPKMREKKKRFIFEIHKKHQNIQKDIPVRQQ